MTRARDLADSADKDIAGTLTLDGLNVNADNTNAPQVVFENSHSVTTDAAISTYDDAAGVGITLGSNYYLNSAGSEARFNTSEESAGILVDRVGVITLKTDNSGSAVAKDRLNIAGNGDISFYEDTGTTAKLFWDASAEGLSLGTTDNPNSSPLYIRCATDDNIRIQQETHASIQAVNNAASAFTELKLDGSSLLLNSQSGGNVGIGTASPTRQLTVSNSGAALLLLESTGDDNSQLLFGDSASDTVGKVGYSHSTNHMFFNTNASEAMRIDSSGNLLVGKTSSDATTAGFEAQDNGQTIIGRANGTALKVNRLSSDGPIAQFRKDGTNVGQIGNLSTNLYIGTPDNALVAFGTNRVYPANNDGSARDNAIDLGNTNARFDDIYATNGTIQTSDEREKQQIASLTDAEIIAAKAISKLFKTFKWNDAVTEKGDNARTHAGVIAQQVQTAMSDAGLDATKYAFFIDDTWWETQTEVPAVEADEENGIEAQEAYTRTDNYYTQEEAPEGATERNRKGIRYPELLSFIGATTEQRLASIESRLDALEAE